MYVLITDGVWIALLVPVLANNQTGDWWPGTRGAALLALGLVLFVAGLALAVRAGGELIEQGEGTPMPIRPPARLVASGPYSRIRNPMSLGFLLSTLGAAVIVDASHVFLLPGLAAAYVLLMQLPAEKRQMEEKHGPAYVDYRSRVPAWFPSRLTSPEVKGDRP